MHDKCVISGGAHVAQLVEHFLGKGEVTGSIPVAGSMKICMYMLTTLLDLKWRRTKLLRGWFAVSAKGVTIRSAYPKKELWVRLN